MRSSNDPLATDEVSLHTILHSGAAHSAGHCVQQGGAAGIQADTRCASPAGCRSGQVDSVTKTGTTPVAAKREFCVELGSAVVIMTSTDWG